MAHEVYERTLETAKAEMGELLRQRNEIDARIAKLAPVIEYVSVLCDEIQSPPPDLPMPSQADMGLSDAIRMAFKSAMLESLTPTEVRDKLKESGFNLDKYASELPPIHNTIARLKEQGEIEEIARPNGDRAFKWVSSLKRALLEIEPKTYGAPTSLANMMAEMTRIHADPAVMAAVSNIGAQMEKMSQDAVRAITPFARELEKAGFFKPGNK